MTENQHIAQRETQRTRENTPLVLAAFLALGVVLAAGQARADITNSAVAQGTYSGNAIVSPPSVANVPVAGGAPGLSVVKVATPDTNVPAGGVVTYTFTVTNTGNQTLQNISLNDVHNGTGITPVPGNETLLTDSGTPGDSTDATAADGVWSVLAPGDAITFTSTYTVTQTDVDTRQ